MGRVYTPFSKEDLMPQEEKLEIAMREGKLSIGIPKETHYQEKRVCLSPDAVEVLVKNGHSIVVESGAGLGAHFTDNQYSEAGAKIAHDAREVFEQPIVIKIAPPLDEEIEYLKPNHIVVSAVMPNTLQPSYFEKLSKKRITAIGMDFFRDAEGHLPILRLIDEISGTTAVLVASELLSTSNGGNGVMLGGIAGVRPAEVVIIGADTIGEYAARSALGLGASVRVFDSSITRLRQLQIDLNNRIPTSTLDPKELSKALMRCDVAIGALENTCRTPNVVPEEMVMKMKPGAVIVDACMDHGGCFETGELTTHENPIVIKHNVIHYGVANIASRFARTATKALSNFFLPYLIQVGDEGGFDRLIQRDRGLQQGIYIFRGRHTNRGLAKWFDLHYTDLNLLIF